MKRRKSETRFVLCIGNEGCEDLEPRKVYQVLPDEAASEDGYVRVIDESGEDYLYPAGLFRSHRTAAGGGESASVRRLIIDSVSG
jgi:hypothetical protein